MLISYKGVRVSKSVIVEEVPIYEYLVRNSRLVHLTFLGQPEPTAIVNELDKGINIFLFVGLRCIFAVGIFFQTILLGIERVRA